MKRMILDPWTDAAEIAARLSRPDAGLVIAIGAEAWCDRCRTLRPYFDAAADARNVGSSVWLWLDLEDHAEFVGDFVPDSLPLLIRYDRAVLTHAFVADAESGAWEAMLNGPSLVRQLGVPDLRERLMQADWAS